MINTAEFERYKQLEKDCMELHTAFHLETVAAQVVQLPGSLPITVQRNSPRCQKYDFVMTRFGVVKWLSDDGMVIDKSPLCLELDKALRERLHMLGRHTPMTQTVHHSHGTASTQPVRTNAIADTTTPKRGLL